LIKFSSLNNKTEFYLPKVIINVVIQIAYFIKTIIDYLITRYW